MPKPSAHSKRCDQKYMSRDELRKFRVVKIVRRIVRDAHFDFERKIESLMGNFALARLKNSAARRKMSPLTYMEKVLLK